MSKIVVGEFRFTWDDAKEKDNMRNHKGLSFSDAASIWMNPGIVLDIPDERFNYGEDRWIAIGPLPGDQRKIVLVAYTERNEEIRIITARYAEKSEGKAYRERFKKGELT
jgi:uncharacterized DUF497 family protein